MTNLNNAMMKTVVETFIIEETQELIYDNEKLDQWNDLVDKLGLAGQTKICAPQKSPIPFLPMKRNMVNVFQTLCPAKVAIENYDKTPIPVEILSLVSLSVREKYFNKVEIWYDDKDPDPACIGITGEWVAYSSTYARLGSFVSESEAKDAKETNSLITYMSFSETQKYLIGRWADVKMTMSELTAKAKIIFMGEKKNRLTKEIRDAQRQLEDLELDTDREFGIDAPASLPF